MHVERPIKRFEQPGIESYPYIWAWHKLTGAYDYYVIDLCEQALADEAPSDATYKDAKGMWQRASALDSSNTMRTRMNEYIRRHAPKIEPIIADTK
jgi:hypothetical protein